MRTRGRLTLMIALSVPVSAFTQTGGPEILLNTTTVGDQVQPTIAVESDGGFVVAWRSGSAIVARRLDASGAPRSGELAVSLNPVATDTQPVVASFPGGGFVVAWHAPDTSGHGIFLRRFDATGQPIGGEVIVNVGPIGDQKHPRIAGGPLGYVVAWTSISSVVGRLLDGSGTPLGVEIPVGNGNGAAVAWRGNGLVFAWAEGGAGRVSVRLFDGAGAPLGPPSQANGANPPMPCGLCIGSYTRSGIGVTSAASGSFVVSWDLSGYAAQGGLLPMPFWSIQFGSYVRRYDAGGSPMGPETVVNGYSAGSQHGPSVAIAPYGHTFVAWTSAPIAEGCGGAFCFPPDPPPPPQDGSGAGVYARVFDAAGNGVGGGEFRVNATTLLDQSLPAVAMTDSGAVVAYQSPDAAGYGIYARRFSGFPPVFTPAGIEVDPVGNRVFEIGETVEVAPAWRNTIGTAQALASLAMGYGGLAGPTYSIVDASADYGVIPNGATASCRDTGNCFLFSVAGTRPATHWDAYFTEYGGPPLFAPRARTLHIGESFVDVPRSSPFYRFVETVFHHTVITRCANASFCPSLSVSREAMAFHVLRAAAPTLVPPNCVAGSERFPDLPATNTYCPYVEELARRGVVGGCGGGLYCPGQGVSREAMAVFLLLTREGTGYVPPACTVPPFSDVSVSSPFCRWIAELARRGIVGGCGGGAYCPAAPVSREQMSVFLTGTFGLLLYAP